MATILIVDDSMLMRKNLKTILVNGGHTIVAEASNGMKAYSEYVKYRPDLVTMDITMPLMDGIEALKKIKSEFKEAKIIMISALEQKNLAFEALENGALHYILKPLSQEKVLSVVDEVMRYSKIDEYKSEAPSKDDAFDSMWIEIKQSKEEIIELNKSLEQMVNERTTQLEETNCKLKETLNQLNMAQEQLIQSEKTAALAGMVTGVAHEVNTPIGVSMTAMSYLQECTQNIQNLYSNKTMKRSEFEKYIENSNEICNEVLLNLRRASELIRSFKMVAVDQFNDDKRIFNVKKYIDDIILSLKSKIKNTNYKINVSCEDKIEINSYPGAFSQVLTNLIMNSLIHGFDDRPDGNININVNYLNGTLLLEHIDDGKGISKENIHKIFNPFFTTKRGRGGTGLGLNIVYNIVTQKFNGEITCESELNKGTAFIIKFPA